MSQLDHNLERLRRKVDARVEELLILRRPTESTRTPDLSAFTTPAMPLPMVQEPLVLAGEGEETVQDKLAILGTDLHAPEAQSRSFFFKGEQASSADSEASALEVKSNHAIAVTSTQQDGNSGEISATQDVQRDRFLPTESVAAMPEFARADAPMERETSGTGKRSSANLPAPHPIGFFARMISRLGLRQPY